MDSILNWLGTSSQNNALSPNASSVQLEQAKVNEKAPLSEQQVLISNACSEMDKLVEHIISKSLKPSKSIKRISEGIELLRKGKLSEAFEQFELCPHDTPSYEQERIDTLKFCKGMMYEHGWGVQQNYYLASYEYALASKGTRSGILCHISDALLAEQGHSSFNSNGKVNPTYEMAALAKGCAKGYYHLARFLHGGGRPGWVPEDKVVNDSYAVDFFKEAVKRGDTNACRELAKIYRDGGLFSDINKDDYVADFWLHLAEAKNINQISPTPLNHPYSKAQFDFHSYFPIAIYGLDQINKNYLTTGVSDGRESYATAIAINRGIELDPVNSFWMFATDQSAPPTNKAIAEAMYKIGQMYETGTYTRKSKTETIKFYEAAYEFAKQIVPQVSVDVAPLPFTLPELAKKLAELHSQSGFGSATPKNPVKAEQWSKVATQQ